MITRYDIIIITQMSNVFFLKLSHLCMIVSIALKNTRYSITKLIRLVQFSNFEVGKQFKFSLVSSLIYI